MPDVFVKKFPLDIGFSAAYTADDNVVVTLGNIARIAVELFLIPIHGELLYLIGYLLFSPAVAEFLYRAVYRAEKNADEKRGEHPVTEQQRRSEHQLEISAAHSPDKHEDNEQHPDDAH